MLNIYNKVVDKFKDIKGVHAIVVGGSRATENSNEHSDIDIGIYYDPHLFDLETFKKYATQIDDKKRIDVITNIGDWGRWINGGGWLQIDGIPTDILFRDFERVVKVVDDCLDGIITIDYQSGHPFGFVNSIYMAEVACCQVLFENNTQVSCLQRSLHEFPSNYRKAAIQKFLWEAEFALQNAKKAISKKDIVYISGSIFRCIICLVYALYAVNRVHLLNEKGAISRMNSIKNMWYPCGFIQAIERIISKLTSYDIISNNIETLEKYIVEIQSCIFTHKV